MSCLKIVKTLDEKDNTIVHIEGKLSLSVFAFMKHQRI